MGNLYLVSLGRGECGVYADTRKVGPGELGTSLMVKGSMEELTAFFVKKDLPVPMQRG
jgi:hypothetical protein